MYWAVQFLFNDLLLPNFSGNIIFYIPLNLLCSATERNVDFHYRNWEFFREYKLEFVQTALLKFAVLINIFKKEVTHCRCHCP